MEDQASRTPMRPATLRVAGTVACDKRPCQRSISVTWLATGALSAPGRKYGRVSRAKVEQGENIMEERGAVSILELLVASALMILALGAVLVLYDVSVGGQQRTENRVNGLVQQQIGMEQMTRELRQAVSVTPISSQTIDAVTYVGGSGGTVQRRIRYECTQGTCSRWEGPPTGSSWTSGPISVITNVVNSDVFGVEPDFINPDYLTLNVEVSVKGSTAPITLSGGFALRNIARDS